MNRAEKIRKLLYKTFRESEETTGSAAMDERILSDASTCMKQVVTAHGRAYRIFTWRNIMKGRIITKLATAAIIVIAAAMLINHFGGSINESGVVFAEVVRNIQSANSAVWHEQRVITCNGEELPFLKSDALRYYSLEYGGMEAMYNMDDILLHRVYWLPEKDVRIEVVPLLKQYRRTEFTEAERAIGGRSVEAIVELVKSEKPIKLGCSKINGREAEGFEIKDSKIAGALVPVEFDSMVARFWIDVETSLPLRYEAELVISDRHITVFTGGIAVEAKVIGDKFQWDVDLEPSIFEPNIPSDYTQMEY